MNPKQIKLSRRNKYIKLKTLIDEENLDQHFSDALMVNEDKHVSPISIPSIINEGYLLCLLNQLEEIKHKKRSWIIK